MIDITKISQMYTQEKRMSKIEFATNTRQTRTIFLVCALKQHGKLYYAFKKLFRTVKFKRCF